MKTESENTSHYGNHFAEDGHECERRCFAIDGESVGKSRITMRVDNDVLAVFKARADKVGGSYQTMMNNALKEFARGLTLSDIIRQAVQETLQECLIQEKLAKPGGSPR